MTKRQWVDFQNQFDPSDLDQKLNFNDFLTMLLRESFFRDTLAESQIFRQSSRRLVFSDEWEQSIVESHPASPSRDQAVEKHRSDVGLIRKALGKYLPALALAKGPDPPVRWF